MPANVLLSGDDSDSAQNWDACWSTLQGLAGRDLPAATLKAEAAQVINSCRALTEGRGIEQIEERARTTHRLVTGQLSAGSDERLNRFVMVLDGALSVLRQTPRETAR